jgi:S-DNA-T family DNA segregation ATPase FtsK/SpoIIIE
MAKRTKNKNENRAKSKRGNDKRIPILLGLFFVGLSFIILVSFISFLFSWQSDSMIMDISVGELLTDVDIKYSNWMGKLGVFLSVTLITKWVGVPAFLIIPIIFLFGMRFFGKKIMPFRATAIRLIVVMFWLSIALSYLFVDRYFLLGGAHGHYMSRWIESMLGKAGTGLFILFLVVFQQQEQLPEQQPMLKTADVLRSLVLCMQLRYLL